MSLPRDTLLFSIVVMLWAVRIEASGFGSSQSIVVASLLIGVIGLIGSFASSMRAIGQNSKFDTTE